MARPGDRLDPGGGQAAAATITLAHGSGGKAMRDLVERVFVARFDNPELSRLDDQARFDLTALAAGGERLAFTTDSYVVTPLFFNGGDIGKLAVCGTVNDLAVGGARPLYLSCAVIAEEGLPIAELEAVADSMAAAAAAAGVQLVTGDTKVVARGAADKLFINTAGIGVIPAGIRLDAGGARPGDKVLINGFVGDHGAAIVDARGELALDIHVDSDCRALHRLVGAMLGACPRIRCLRDATRGGLAAVLNEFAASSRVGIRVDERAVPLRDAVRGVCEILGLDPLYLANEGKVVAVVPADAAPGVLAAMRAHPDGADAAIIGEVSEQPAARVILETGFGGDRILDMPIGELLPRIC